MSLTTGKVHMGTRPTVSLHWRSAAECMIEMTKICVISSTTEMHAVGSKTDTKSKRIEQERRNERDYDYYGPFYDQPHRQWSPEGGCNARGVKVFYHDLKKVRWPLNFKLSGIEKYDGSTNLAEWLEVYQHAIETTGGDSYVMANYLSICLSSSARMWLLGLPSRSVRSWSHLCRLLTSNFCATCTHPGVD
jgi:hypothetical protein